MDDGEIDDGEKVLMAATAARKRTDELMRVAVALVASGRATISEAAHLVGCSRQRLHEQCRSYASYSAHKNDLFKHPRMAQSDRAQSRRWGYLEAKPIPRDDMGAPRREYLDKVWSRLVTQHDREQAQFAQQEADRQARWDAGDYSD